jgi:DNA-binding NarL/FixJ family response regulator
MTERKIRVVVADDQPDVRSAFRLVLDSQPDIVVAGEAADGEQALKVTRHLRPDVVLMDIRMPRLDGLEVTRELLRDPRTADVRVVVVTTFDLDEYVVQALKLGACGFLLKRSGPTLLIESVRAAVSGDMLISPQITVRLLRHLRTPAEADAGKAVLSRRETEIAAQVAQGKTNAEIAAELFISPGTVKTHLANIGDKLGIRNRVGVAAWAWEHGIVGTAQKE